MAIKWTGYDRIKLDNGVAISVSSETPGSTSAHTEVVDAIIEAVSKIDGSDKPTNEAASKIDGSDKPTYGAIADTGEVICGGATNADPEPEEPAGNPPTSLGESAPKGKPRLLIDIAKSTNSSEGAMEAISLSFRNLYEALDRDEKRAMAFVECITSTKYDDVQMVSMSNGQVIMAQAFACRPVGHDKLVALAMLAIARVARMVAVDYDISVR